MDTTPPTHQAEPQRAGHQQAEHQQAEHQQAVPQQAVPQQAVPQQAVPLQAAEQQQRRRHRPYALHKTRLLLRLAATILLFTALFLWAAIVAKCRNSAEACSTGASASQLEVVLLIVPIVWNLAEFTTLKFNKRGIHPGAHVGWDLVIWFLLQLPAAGAIVRNAVSSTYRVRDCDDEGVCVSRTRYARSNNGIGMAYGVIMSIAATIHLILFIIACITVHKWRMAQRAKRATRNSQSAGAVHSAPIHLPANADGSTSFMITMPNGQLYMLSPQGQAAPQQQQQQQMAMSQQSAYGHYAPVVPAQTGSMPVVQQGGAARSADTDDVTRV